MCYETWNERNQVTEKLEKARQEADKAIEKAQSARPERRPETQTPPAVESEETAV